MREILFRGKRIDNGEWVQGSYVETLRYNNLHWIWDGKEYVKIDPETIGQYTGLTDKNGKKIFEGDVVKDNNFNYRLLCDNRNKCRTGVAVIKYGLHEVPSEDPFCWGDAFGFYFEGETLYPTPAQYHPYNEYSKSTFEVIGNIHDDPELLQ